MGVTPGDESFCQSVQSESDGKIEMDQEVMNASMEQLLGNQDYVHEQL